MLSLLSPIFKQTSFHSIAWSRWYLDQLLSHFGFTINTKGNPNQHKWGFRLFLTNISIHFYLLGWVVANIYGTWTNIWQKSNVNKCVNFPHGQIFYQAVTKQQICSRATMAKYWKPNWKVWGEKIWLSIQLKQEYSFLIFLETFLDVAKP